MAVPAVVRREELVAEAALVVEVRVARLVVGCLDT